MALKTPLSDDCIEALRLRKNRDNGSWKRVAQDLGVCENTVYRLLSRNRGVGTDVASRISAYLEMPLDHVYVRLIS